jgi:voltage-gated potassium channel
MKSIRYGSTALWSTILTCSVIFAVFVLPVLAVTFHHSFFKIIYSLIYLSAILSLEKKNIYLFILFFSTFIIEWISGILNMRILLSLSKLVNIAFFLVIVISLIRQIAIARKVSARIILASITGYLLLGLIFSIFILFVMQNDPEAFSKIQSHSVESLETINTSTPIYYSFVTFSTLGYGDLVPIKPYSRSLATFIAVTGQLYIAVIVALLVGKFSAQQNRSD